MSFQAVLWKDAKREWHTRDGLLAGVVVVLLFFLLDLFSFAQATDVALLAFLLWTPLLYGAVAAVGRGMSQEADKGTLELLLSLPVGALAIAGSRTLVDVVLVLLLGLAGVGSAWALYGAPISASLLLVLGLGGIGMGIVGSLAGALSSHGQQRESLLPMLMIPVLAPLMHSGLAATRSVLAGADILDASGAMIMLGYDTIMLGAAALLWPFALEEA